MTNADDLVAWLRAQLDDDERLAWAALPGPWKPDAEHEEVLSIDGITVAEGFALSGRQLRATVDHIARWDPVRVLAEVDAMRRLIVLCSTDIGAEEEGLANRTLELAALPYADRPGYHDEWRP